MTRVQAYSHRRLLFAASTFSLIAVVVIIPWRLVAQEQKLNTTNALLKVAEQRLLHAIEVKYTLTQHIEGPTPNHPELEGAPDFVIQRDLLLDLKDFRFAVKRKILSGDNPKTSDPNDGLIKNVWDGKLFTEYQVGENFADISPDLPKKDKKEAVEDWLLRAILVYPPTPGGFGVDDGSLISLLRRGHLRKGSEEIDGRPCCVVESTDFGRQWVVWLDIERSLAPLKIQTLLDKEVHQEWHLTDFVKLSGDGQDFWFPMKLDLTARNGNSVIQRQIIVDRDITKINPTISDASFHLDFPRGTVVHDEGTNATSVIGRNKNTKVLPQGAAKEAEGTLRREEADNKTNGVLETVERKIVKEPNYTSTPRYALLVLGTKAEAKIWMVEDGNVLYVDKNGNGDLTDDGPPIPQSKIRTFQSDKGACRDCQYVLDELQPLGGSPQTNFCLRHWNYGENEDEYGLSLTLDGKVPMYAGWFDTFWADSPEKVPLIHFGGPLKPKLLRAERFVLGSTLPRLSIAFLNPGSGKGATSYLSIEALPETTVPEVRIDWPVKEGDAPVRTYELLKSRCCYWEFFEQNLKIPSGITDGSATLTISVPHDVFPFDLTTDQIQIPVRAQ
jgi:hypothetical protein